MKYIIIISVGVMLLLLGFVGEVYFTASDQTPSQVEELAEYRDNKIGFAFNYPAGWEVVDTGEYVEIQSSDYLSSDGSVITGAVIAMPKEQLIFTEEWASISDYVEHQMGFAYGEGYSADYIILSEQQAVLMQSTHDRYGDIHDIGTVFGMNNIEIMFGYDEFSYENHGALDEIINSFYFFGI